MSTSNPQLNRRRFLQSAGVVCAGAVCAQAAKPFDRPGRAVLRLSLAAYSLRDFFKPTAAPEKQMDMLKFVDYCAEQGCEGAELTSYYFPPNVTEEFLLQVRRRAFLRGLEISGTAVGNNFSLPSAEARGLQVAQVKRWIDHAAVLGAPHIRVFAGVEPKDFPREKADEVAVAALRECCEYAGKKGIFLGLENHDSIGTAESLLRFVKAVDHPWFGVNLDTGNFRSADPYRDMELTAPYAVNVQVKVELQVDGKKQASDLKRIVRILRAASYQGYVALEYEAAADPFKAIPEALRELKALLAAG